MAKHLLRILLLSMAFTLRITSSLASTENYDESVTEPPSVKTEEILIRQKIMDAQFKCYEKMIRDSSYNKSGPYCNRTWDGWLCWDDTPAGTLNLQNCPKHFPDFDETEKAIKYCDANGNWFKHPENNRTWSNYTFCNKSTDYKIKVARILYYMAVVGHTLSIISLLISLAIFFHFKSLSCQRITLHKNLFFSYVINSVFTLIQLMAVANDKKVVAKNPVGCKVLHFFLQYMLGCNYFWMLCEGIYLHTLIVVAVFAEEQHLHWYYLLGWGFPLIPATIHAVARAKYFNDNCWISVETHLLYIVHAPIVAALLVNLFFLLNIVRVLVTKLRDTHRTESNMYMKAVRATLILVPLLGIQFVIIPWRPGNRLAGEIYDYIMHIFMHYQGLLVATIFCYFNGEVNVKDHTALFRRSAGVIPGVLAKMYPSISITKKENYLVIISLLFVGTCYAFPTYMQAALKRQWMQYKIQLGQRRREHCSMRSTSYTATSITEVPVYLYYQDSNSEHLNGKYMEDSEITVLKSKETYA